MSSKGVPEWKLTVREFIGNTSYLKTRERDICVKAYTLEEAEQEVKKYIQGDVFVILNVERQGVEYTDNDK